MAHFYFPAPVQRGALAQLGERDAGSVEVRGSSPLGSIVPCVFVLSMCKKPVSINLETGFFKLVSDIFRLRPENDIVPLLFQYMGSPADDARHTESRRE